MTRDDGVDRMHRIRTTAFLEDNPKRWAVANDVATNAPGTYWWAFQGMYECEALPTHAEAIAYADTRARGGDHEAGMEAAGRARA